ncbi:uncharacterized protein LOC106085300 [Stomoxys calcitrans]|uniref:Caspase family p20 domain-containing protein n=1 Tax=Stomoxys calcitrans TaxID=35570 RepID=A0A1I8PR62_STOCA|nr:uncharacterized protein LOC106085300 [Stomoxys calcitrans]XP_059224213.1 uncharacterized protein LOC106085300 [Stomoxys calcitrans]
METTKETSNEACAKDAGEMKLKCFVIIVGFDLSRDGLKEDIERIKNTFRRLFDATILILENKTKKEIMKEYRNLFLNKHTFAEYKFVAVFCLSHGLDDGQLILNPGREIVDAQRLLLNPFFKFEQLDQKLKWLVVQSCRGDLNDYRPLQHDGITGVFPDFHFISYCTGEGTVSFQLNTEGKIYIQTLCKELETNVREKSLCEMLDNVNLSFVNLGIAQPARPDYKKNVNDYRFYE